MHIGRFIIVALPNNVFRLVVGLRDKTKLKLTR